MKPKAQNEHEEGLLENLEDIIRTSKYKQSIEEEQALVDQLNEKLNRHRVRLLKRISFH
jgi:structural maintenance of chromosome 4